MSCTCAVCRAVEMTERDPRLRIAPLAKRAAWIMLVRAFDVHGIGRGRYLAASRDVTKLSDLVGLPVEEMRPTLQWFEEVGLLRRNGSGEVYLVQIFMSMVNLRRKWRRERQQLSLEAGASA